MHNITEMLKGVLEGSILEIISRNTTYGYDITQQLKKLGFEDVVEGTVYTILVRLEKNGFVVTDKNASDVVPLLIFRSLTDSGVNELSTFWSKRAFVSSKINELRRK